MKSYKGICKECQKLTWINNSREICTECVYKKNHKGKSKQQTAKENQKVKKVKPRKTGEKELFLEIWEERPHYCENQLCRKWLGNEPKAINFSHRLSKGSHGEIRLEKSNIDLLCPDCHYTYEFGDRSKIKLN